MVVVVCCAPGQSSKSLIHGVLPKHVQLCARLELASLGRS